MLKHLLSFVLAPFSYLMSIYGLIIVIAGIITIGVLLVIALKPRLFWPMLIVITVGTGGIVIRSIGLLDEYLTGCILLGAFLVISIGKVRLWKNRENALDQLHLLIFLIMIGYMIIQSLYGMMELGSLRKIRWIVYFGMLGVLSLVISKKGFPVPSKRKLSLIIVWAALGYFLLYSASGLFCETVLKESKWNLLGGSWAGTTYTVFPLVIVMPALIFLAKDKKRTYRLIALITLLIIMFFAFYFESRISWLLMLAFFIVSLPLLGIRKTFLYLLLFSLFLFVFVQFIWPKWFTIEVFAKLLVKTTEILWHPSESHDIGRLMHLRIAFPIISSDLKTLLFGYGFRTSGPLIGPNLAKLYIEAGRPDIAERVINYQSTIGFTTILVETGLIGFLLLVMNFFFVARQLLLKKEIFGRGILLFSLLATFLWLFTGTLLDIVLFYLIIMPSGLLLQLSRPQDRTI